MNREIRRRGPRSTAPECLIRMSKKRRRQEKEQSQREKWAAVKVKATDTIQNRGNAAILIFSPEADDVVQSTPARQGSLNRDHR